MTALRVLRAIAFAALLLSQLAAREADAAACCMSATSGGVGRLLIWEKAAAGLQVAPTIGTGFWSTNRQWLPYSSYREMEWRVVGWGLVRASRRTTFHAILPVVHNRREAGTLRDEGTGIGDVSAGVRYELLGIGELLGWPSISFTGSVVAPTGRAAHQARQILAADATGRGAWVASLATGIEVTHQPLFARLDIGLAVPLPFERDDLDETQRFGESVQTTLTGGWEIHSDVVTSVAVRGLWEARTVQEGKRIDGTSRSDIGVGISVAYRIHDHVTVTAAGDTGIFVRGAGKNQQGRVSATLGLRFGIF